MTKLLLSLLLLSTLNTAHALSIVLPDIQCVEDSQFTYNFYFGPDSKVNIQTFNEKGEFLFDRDGTYSVKSQKSFPPILTYFIFDEDNHEYAYVTHTGGSTTGSGEFIDNDQMMACTINQ